MFDTLGIVARELKNIVGAERYRRKLERVYPTCRFYPGSMVDDRSTLGKHNVVFNDASIINSRMGDHTFVQRATVINNAEVGKFCSIAMNVNIGLTQHALSFVSTHPALYLLDTPLQKTFSKSDMFETSRRTEVGNDVWIGQNSMIMGGVSIGTGAVVGAGSVVTDDVVPYAIVGGIPAKVIKYRFDLEIIEALLRSKWWETPDDELEKIHHLCTDPAAFLKALRDSHE